MKNERRMHLNAFGLRPFETEVNNGTRELSRMQTQDL